MKLLEHEGKALLKRHGIAVPNSWLITNKHTPEFDLPVVLKSQVPTGGRGKAGGIIIVKNGVDILPDIDKLRKLAIKQHKPKTILAEELLDIAGEYYIAVTINRSAGTIELVANNIGGIDVESNDSASFFRLSLNQKTLKAAGQKLATYLNLQKQQPKLQQLVANLYNCMIDNDALLIEINPLVLTQDQKIIAGDCKIELDSAALFRHADWHFETELSSDNFVTLDRAGTVATVANGAGLAMATVDAVADYGMQPANFLDIGGGANSDTVLAAFQKIMDYPNIQSIIINIFAGITRCDEVASAIITARKQIDDLPPLFIRLAGTNVDTAKQLLQDHDIKLLPTLEECVKAAKAEVYNG